jgi:hypothetical protein
LMRSMRWRGLTHTRFLWQQTALSPSPSSPSAHHPYDHNINIWQHYTGVDKSLARAGRKIAIGTEDFEFHIPYL